jgi:hypothetical protein
MLSCNPVARYEDTLGLKGTRQLLVIIDGDHLLDENVSQKVTETPLDASCSVETNAD